GAPGRTSNDETSVTILHPFIILCPDIEHQSAGELRGACISFSLTGSTLPFSPILSGSLGVGRVQSRSQLKPRSTLKRERESERERGGERERQREREGQKERTLHNN